MNAPNIEACEIGATRACSIELGTQGNVVNCASGTQHCETGYWSICKWDGAKGTYSVPAPSPKVAGVRVQALAGSAVNCEDNPCNPFCNTYTDVAEPEVTTEPSVTVLSSTGGSLASSNVPTAFKNKGTLDGQCTRSCTEKSCLEACQFDQHCGTRADGSQGCVPFEKRESGACSGVDITAPTSCVSGSGYRKLTVCNRGTLAAAPGVKCFVFSGGSPKYPEDAPSLRHAKLVMTTETTLKAGDCETQELSDSVFPNQGIESLMCNPPGTGVGGFIEETLAGAAFPSLSATSTWTHPERAFVADGNYATADSTSVTSVRYATRISTSDWTDPMAAYVQDNVSASVSLPASGGITGKFATSNTNSGWSAPASAYVAGEAELSVRYATTTLAAPGYGSATTTSARFPTSFTGNTCNNGSSCTFQNPSNVFAKESPPALSPSWTSATLSQYGIPDSNAIYYGGFSFAEIPSDASITSVTLTVSWRGNHKIAAARVQAYKADGTATNSFVARTGSGSGNPFEETLTSTQSYALGTLTRQDIMGSRFLKVTATHSDNSSSDTFEIDYISVVVSYRVPVAANTATLTLGNFGIQVPSGAIISDVRTEVKWKASSASSTLSLGVQPYSNGVGLGSELSVVAPSTAESVHTHSVPSASLAQLSAAAFADSAFTVRVRATRTADGSPTDITSYLDYVKVSVTYAMPQSSPQFVLGGFGFSIPSNALLLDLTTSARWGVTVANPNVTLGVQPLFSTLTGTELTTVAGSSPPTALTLASSTIAQDSNGSALTSAHFADDVFKVRVRATRMQGEGDVGTSALLDVVSARTRHVNTAIHTVDYSGFNFNLPESRDLMRVTAEVKWRISAANSNVAFGLQAFKDGGLTPVGDETRTAIGSSPPTVDTVTRTDLDLSQLQPVDLNSSAFTLRIRAIRGNSTSTNPDFSALLDYVKLEVTYGTPTGGNLVECNPYNNWSATKVNPDGDACEDNVIIDTPSFTVSRVFHATCRNAEDKNPRWSFFGYTSRTPSDSKISFRFRAFAPTNGECVPLPPVVSEPPAPYAVARSTPSDTQVCSFSANTPGCPVSLFDRLGTSATLPCLQMDAHGVPSSDGLQSPALVDWTARFDCLDNQ